MKYLIAAVAALLLSIPFTASADFNGCPFSAGSCNDNSSVDDSITATGGTAKIYKSGNSYNHNTVKGKQEQDQEQEQGQGQGQLQGQAQKAKANNEGVTGNSVEFTQTYEAGNYAPDAYAPSTAPCTIGIGGSFGNSVFSGGMSTGYTDEVCQDLEVVRAGVNSTDPEMQKGAKKLYGLVLNDRLNRYDANVTPEGEGNEAPSN